MSKSVLLTAAPQDAERALENLGQRELDIYHYPLERYVPFDDQTNIKAELEALDDYENVVYGNSRNALFFLEKVKEHEKIETLKDRLNLTLDQPTADLLEEEGIPAVCTHGDKKPISLVEFMLRLRRFGATLYPCGSHKKEEVPGFLYELDISVMELELFDLEGPEEDDLLKFQKRIDKNPPDVVLFHSRRSVTRTLTAFPSLDLNTVSVFTADTAITRKLEENDIDVDHEGEGSWESMIELI